MLPPTVGCGECITIHVMGPVLHCFCGLSNASSLLDWAIGLPHTKFPLPALPFDCSSWRIMLKHGKHTGYTSSSPASIHKWAWSHNGIRACWTFICCYPLPPYISWPTDVAAYFQEADYVPSVHSADWPPTPLNVVRDCINEQLETSAANVGYRQMLPDLEMPVFHASFEDNCYGTPASAGSCCFCQTERKEPLEGGSTTTRVLIM